MVPAQFYNSKILDGLLATLILDGLLTTLILERVCHSEILEQFFSFWILYR